MNKLFEDAMPYVENKTRASKEMSRVAKQVREITHYDLEDISLYKDMLHYKGLGWTDTPLTKPDPDVRFKDRVSPCFRRLVDLVRVAKEFGDVEILKEYLSAMHDIGIDIIIRDIPDNTKVYNETKDLMEVMNKLQGKICFNANQLRDMGDKAEEEKLCPKTKFKRLAECRYKLEDDENGHVKDGLHDVVADNLLHNHGIQEVLEDVNE